MSKVFCVVSENDGIGKSYLTLSIANQCVAAKDSRLLIIELATGEKDIASYFEVDDEIIYDVCDVIAGVCDVEQSIIEIEDAIDYLPAPRVADKINDISRKRLKDLIARMAKLYDNIIVEVSNLASNFFMDYEIFDKLIFVTDNNYDSIKDLISAKAIFSGLDNRKIIYVFNKSKEEKSNFSSRLSSYDIILILGDFKKIYVSEDEEIKNFSYRCLKKKKTFNEVLKLI